MQRRNKEDNEEDNHYDSSWHTVSWRHIDTEIVLDSMTFDKDSRTIGYYYTLQGSLDNPLRVDSAQFSEALLLEVKNSTNLKLYKDAGYSFRYTYHSEKDSGTKLFEATFRENDYR